MDLKRFFTDTPITQPTVTLSGAEFVHAVKVTRHKTGYQIILCDRSQYDYYAVIEEIGKDSLVARIIEKKLNETENYADITLYIGMNKDIDTVIQKAVELGVNRVVPFFSQHSMRNELSLDRAKRIVLESAKQCGRSRLTEVFPSVDIFDALNVARDTKCIFFYEHEKENRVSKNFLCERESVSVFIGPEGGFAAGEVEYARSVGITPCTLGRRILRVSTAVVAAVTITLERLGEL